MDGPCSRPPAQHCGLNVQTHLTSPLTSVNMVQFIAAAPYPPHSRSIPPSTGQGSWGRWGSEEPGARIHEDVRGSGRHVGDSGEQWGQVGKVGRG